MENESVSGNTIPPSTTSATAGGAPPLLPPPAGNRYFASGDVIHPSTPPKDPVIAVILNAFVWALGLGYFYIGQWQKGVVAIATPVALVLFTILTCGLAAPLLALICLLPPLECIDAYLQAKSLEKGLSIGQWTFFHDHRQQVS